MDFVRVVDRHNREIEAILVTKQEKQEINKLDFGENKFSELLVLNFCHYQSEFVQNALEMGDPE